MAKDVKRSQCTTCRQREGEHSAACVEFRQYRRLRVFVTVVTLILIGITVALNVMHAPANVGGRLIGGTPPVFVFFCIELISLIPGTSRWLAFGRVAASIVVAGISFSISYDQQAAFIKALGFVGWVALAYPIIIDGVMVVSTLSMVEVTRKVRALRRDLVRPTATTSLRPVFVDPTLHLEDERTQAYRQAAAAMRGQSQVAALNGKSYEPAAA